MRSPARLFPTLCAILAPLALTAFSAVADAAADRHKLDALFAQLRIAPSETAARATADQIWSVWTHPSDAVLAERLDAAIDAMAYGPVGALALLDALVVEFPDFAEAWNQRATMHFHLGNYRASLADIEMTLALEPRHFGALAGRVLINLTLGDRDAATRDILAALAIHPFLPERSLFPELAKPTPN